MHTGYDIFISFKATENGVLTSDVAVATELYHLLVQSGYHVFFSSETMTKGGSSDFSKEIDNALDEARLLIVVSSKAEYVNSRWVEYEWKTFNADILSNIKPNAQIVTFTEGINTAELPRILRYVQNFGFSNRDALLTFVGSFFERYTDGKALTPIASANSRGGRSNASPCKGDRSLYNSANSGEFEILRIQEKRSYTMDVQAIQSVKQRLDRNSYNVLVVGCAYGFIAETRFGLDDDVENVICVDKNPEVLEKARELYRNYPHMKFYCVDVESSDYVCNIQKICREERIEGFDIVFSSNIMRFLNNPQACIRNTRRILRSGGMMILREGDDATKIAYPDPEGILRAIEQSSAKAPGMPNYTVGRELPGMIRNSGFVICDVLTDICTTVNMTFEQKENFFISTFGSRKSIARQIAARDGVETEELTHLISHIDRMENLFYNTDFWYSESNLLFVAQKQ